MRTICKFSRSEISDEQVQTMFEVLDMTGEGSIDVGEFNKFLMDTGEAQVGADGKKTEDPTGTDVCGVRNEEGEAGRAKTTGG